MKKNILNRVLALILVLCMACSMTVMVSADDGPSVSLSVSAARSGNTVNVTVKMGTPSTAIRGIQYRVTFDTDDLTYNGDASGSIFGWSFSSSSSANSNGYVNCAGDSGSDVTSGGTLATMSFAIKESASGGSSFGLGNAKGSLPDGTTFAASTSGTSIEVAGYKVTVATAENGSVKVSDSKPFKGDTVTVTTTPDSGYVVKSVSVTTSGGDSVSVSSDGNSHTFKMPGSAVTVSATFGAKDYAVSKGDIKNGSVTIDKTSAKKGDTITVTATPADGYENPTVTVSGVTVTDAGNGKFTFTMPASDVTVNASFSAKTYTISKGETANGSFAVASTAKTGDTVTVTTTPKDGYEVSKITVSGATVKDAGGGKYTFTMPASNVTVNVTFGAKAYKITKDDVKNGSISVAASAKTGETVTVTVTPAAGYDIGKVTASGATLTNAGDGKYTFVMPASDVKISASFAAKTFKINTEKPKNGKMEVASSAKTGETVAIKLTANKGYAVTELIVKDASGKTIKTAGEGSTRTFTMPASDVTISVTFKKSDFKVSVSAGEGGSASADKTTAGYDDVVTVTVTPKDHYKVGSVKVTDADENSVKTESKDGKYTFKMPNSNVTVKVTFKGEEYTISAGNIENGKISVASKGTYGTKISFQVKEDEGFKVASVKVTADGKTVKVSGSNGKYSFTMPAAKVKIAATIEAVIYTITPQEAENGTFVIGADSGKMADVITVDTTPEEGYQVNSLTIFDAKGNLIPFSGENNAYTFVMPASNVTVAVSFEEIPIVTYTLNIAQPENATITLDKTDAGAGSIVTVTVTPNEGYQTVSVDVLSAAGEEIFASGNENVWTFIMPDGEVTVGATVEPSPEPEPEPETEVEIESEIESEIEEEPAPVKTSNGALTWILLFVVLLLAAVAIIIIVILKKRR
ncbi:MAG: hypothetical protein IKM13_06505 [Clostridia bacterium]|nr:hypothetical protein [Clostridia bacterium]